MVALLQNLLKPILMPADISSETIREKPRPRFDRTELLLLLVICVGFFIINLITGILSPLVWQDEVQYADPAVNLYLGNGFVSGAWPSIQPDTTFWASYLPLYQFLTFGWLHITGFSPIGIRSLDYFLMVAAAGLLWLGVFRLNLVKTRWARLVVILLFLLGHGISWSYRTARPDPLGMLLLAIALVFYSLRSIRWRLAGFVLVGILSSFTGLQLIVYAVLIGVLLILFLGWAVIKELIALGVGVVVGFGLVYLLYTYEGVWNYFTRSITDQSKIILSTITQRLGGGIDRSTVLLLVIGLLLLGYQVWRKTFQWRSSLTFAVLATMVIPIGLFLINKFPIYYSWMVFIPLSIAVCSVVERPTQFPKIFYGLIAIGLFFVCIMGLPYRVVVVAADSNANDYSVVDNFVDQNISSQDWVYCQYAAYYAVKEKAAKTYVEDWSFSANVPLPEEVARINVIISSPTDYPRMAKGLGGQWQDTGQELITMPKGFFGAASGDYNYDLRVYKRVAPADIANENIQK